MHIHETMHSHKYTAARKKPSHSNTRLLVSTVPVSFITVSSYYTNWINSSYSQQSELLPIVCLLFTWRDSDPKFSALVFNHQTRRPQKNDMTYFCGHAASAKYMVSHFTAARADESSSRPTGSQIHLSTQTFCFLPCMCCALKQTRQKVCNVKSVFAQVC